MRIRRFRLLATVCMVLAVAASALAQAQEVLFEGKLQSLDGPNRTITVMGVKIHMPLDVKISSPTGPLAFKDLLGAPFPGRTVRGFMDGTAIVTAEYINGVIEARTVFVEPAENVLQGPVKWINGQFTILGRTMTLLTDPRMKGKIVNAGGLPVDISTAPEGADAAAEGYLGEDGMFYAFLIECDEALVPDGTVATAITRARARDINEIEVIGGTTALSGTVRLTDADTGTRLGDVRVVAGTNYGTFSARLAVTTMPKRIRAVNLADGSRAIVDVQ